jgi:hypothetical protein
MWQLGETKLEGSSTGWFRGWPVFGKAKLQYLDNGLIADGSEPRAVQARRRGATCTAAAAVACDLARSGARGAADSGGTGTTKSNDFIQGFELADKFRTDVVLLDRDDNLYIVLHYDPTGHQLNYLWRPASLLRLRDGASDSNSEADLQALLCLVFAHQDRNRVARCSDVVAGIMFRDVRKGQVVLNDSFLVHPEPSPAHPIRPTAL